MEGFIQLHRKILEWEWYDDPKTFSVFLHCLLKANWKDKNWRGKIIERGSFITSLESLASETKLSVSSVRTCLKKLELTNELTKVGTPSYTLIVINKYDDYQSNDKQDSKQTTIKGQSNDNQMTTTNKDNKGNKDNNTNINSIEVAKATTLKDLIKDNFNDSFLSEIYNKYNISKIDFQDECEAFVLYWQEKSPRGKKQRWEKEKTFDPKLRFRTWMRNNKKWNNNTSKPKGIGALD